VKVLVCGGRNFNNYELLKKELDEILDKHFSGYMVNQTYVISGMTKGADSLAVDYANERGMKVLKFPADWGKYGSKAGPIRNQQMIDEGHPNLVVAFPSIHSRGTYDMIRRAEKHNIKTIVIKEYTDDNSE